MHFGKFQLIFSINLIGIEIHIIFFNFQGFQEDPTNRHHTSHNWAIVRPLFIFNGQYFGMDYIFYCHAQDINTICSHNGRVLVSTKVWIPNIAMIFNRVMGFD